MIKASHDCRLLCTGLVPFIFLTGANILIYSGLRQNNARRSLSRTSVNTRRARSLSVILIVIGKGGFI